MLLTTEPPPPQLSVFKCVGQSACCNCANVSCLARVSISQWFTRGEERGFTLSLAEKMDQEKELGLIITFSTIHPTPSINVPQ